MDDLLDEKKEHIDETDDNSERLEIPKVGGGRAMSPPSVTHNFLLSSTPIFLAEINCIHELGLPTPTSKTMLILPL